MTPRAFLILAAITAIAVLGATFVLIATPEPTRIAEAGRLALPDLADQVDQVVAIDIISASDSVSLQQLPGSAADLPPLWKVLQRGDYPANEKKIRGLLIRLANLPLVERKTAKPELWHRLEVDPPEAAGARGRRVVLRDASGAILADLVVGKRRTLPTAGEDEGVYLRHSDEQQSWLAAGSLPLDSDPVDWAQKEVVHLPGETVRRVQISPPDGEPVIAEVADPEQEVKRLDVLNLPEGRSADPMESARLGAAFAFVELQDVRPVDEVPLPEARFTVTVETLEGLQITAEVAQIPSLADQPWAIFRAGLASGASQDVEERDALKAKAAAINRRVDGWAYMLSPGVFQRLTKRLEDVLAEQGS